MNVAYNMDCMEGMKEFDDGFFDLAVVDPPYGIGVQSMTYTNGGGEREKFGHMAAIRRDYKRPEEWDVKPTKAYFDELFRVSKKQIVFGFQYLTDLLPPCKAVLVWDKRVNDQMTNSFSDCEFAFMSEGLGVSRVFRYCWNGMIQGNMKSKEDRFHPTQKPTELYRWIYGKYANPGDKILDTHLGSGSSRIAAYDAGLDFWGYEIDKDYFEKEEERFAQHTAQMSLFVGG